MLKHLTYSINESAVLKIYEDNLCNFQTYTDHKYTEYDKDWQNGWKILKVKHQILDDIMKDLNIEASPRFYILGPNIYLPTHIDNGTLCCVNFILGSNDPAPITIEGIDYKYKQALIDVSKKHSVQNGPEERIILKFSIKHKTFNEVAEEINYVSN